jgi:hypothetical protein
MKVKLALVLLATLGIVFASGCTTTNPTTGEKEFDEAKTALLLSPFKQGIAIAVKMGAEADVNTGTGLRIAETVISNLLDEGGPIERDTIMARIYEIRIDGLDPAKNSEYVTIIASMVLDEYDILVAYVLRNAVNPESPTDTQRAIRMILETIQSGIDFGLALANPPEV